MNEIENHNVLKLSWDKREDGDSRYLVPFLLIGFTACGCFDMTLPRYLFLPCKYHGDNFVMPYDEGFCVDPHLATDGGRGWVV